MNSQSKTIKNIWIFNHYATKLDEPKTRAYDIGRELIKKGHRVTVFASSFSHYKLEEKYLRKDEKSRTEDCDGVRFVWIKTFPYKKNDWRRALNMISFAWRVFRLGRKMAEKPDIIIGTCVHPFAVLSAYLVARKKKSRFFFEITDLWPQSMIEFGAFSKNNLIVLILGVLEKYLFKKAEKIIIIPPHIDKYIISRRIPKEKIVWIPNGLDLSFYQNMKDYDGGKPNKIVCMYAGIFSQYAGLETILKAAKILQNKGNKSVKFVLLGDGAEKPKLLEMAKSLNLQNVEFHDMVPRTEVLKEYEKADVFISIIKDMVFPGGVSSKKLNDYLASGRPVIFAVTSKNNPVEEARAGITIPSEDPAALAQAAEKILVFTPEKRAKMAKNAKDYAKNYLGIKILAEKLEKLF